MAVKNKTRKHLDWAKVLTSESRLSDTVLVDTIAAKYELPIPSVSKALSRLADRGLLSRVAEGIYLNKLVRDSAPEDFIKLLRPNSYVSFRAEPLGVEYPESSRAHVRHYG